MTMRNAFGDLATDDTLQEANGILRVLQTLLQKLRFPSGFDMAQNRQRVTAAVESGTITTVTTCSTVTNLTNIGAYPGTTLVNMTLRNAWGNTVARRFT